MRPKMYSRLPIKGEKKKNCQKIIKNVLKLSDYKTCLMNDEQMYHKIVKIGHTHHQLETQNMTKKSLKSFFDILNTLFFTSYTCCIIVSNLVSPEGILSSGLLQSPLIPNTAIE